MQEKPAVFNCPSLRIYDQAYAESCGTRHYALVVVRIVEIEFVALEQLSLMVIHYAGHDHTELFRCRGISLPSLVFFNFTIY